MDLRLWGADLKQSDGRHIGTFHGRNCKASRWV